MTKRKETTAHVAMDSRRCTACGKCVAGCPKKVIGNVGFMWHKHVTFKKADSCIGCNKCIKICPNGVFFKPDDGASIHKKKSALSFRVERLLPLAFIATAATGIGLHAAGHGTDHDVWHNWSVAHIASCLLWLLAAGFHLKRHLGWYKTLFSKGIVKERLATISMSVLFLATVITGCMLLSVHGPASRVGLWHYKSGILLIIVTLFHTTRRR
ncbi:MAG: 4Fe-4S dicluster domain-containing protein [Muribaculaceae bacterium]|nr:4Fe-4S dicluster domain-containing protein [Muribaculaceae bacterium]MDE6461967.1 4Fe-4S dicluster domain-containing protein [Muribaculaceae bacterium]